MTAKTHIAVGCAANLLLFQPSTLRNLILCVGVSTIGSVICDVDCKVSESKNGLKKVIAIVCLSLVLILTADHFFGTDIILYFKSNEHLSRLITGFAVVLGISVFGAYQPHRSFMHSVSAVLLMTAGFLIMLPIAAPYLAISMSSHILIDMLNKKKIKLLYPLKKVRVGFNLCYSDGLVNKLMFIIASAVSFIQIGFIIYINSKSFIDTILKK